MVAGNAKDWGDDDQVPYRWGRWTGLGGEVRWCAEAALAGPGGAGDVGGEPHRPSRVHEGRR